MPSSSPAGCRAEATTAAPAAPGRLDRRLRRGAAGTLALRAVSTGLGFGATVLLARLLGAAGYGVYAWALAWAGVLKLPALLGLDKLVVREVARLGRLGAWDAARGVLRRSWQAVAGVSAALVAIAVLGAWIVLTPGDARLASFLIAMALVPLGALTTLGQSATQGLQRVVLGLAPDGLLRPVAFMALVAAAYAASGRHLSPAAAVGSQVVATALAALLTGWLVRRTLPAALKAARPVYATREWLGSALPLLLIGGMVAVTSQLDIILVGAIKGSEQAGVYSVAARGAALITLASIGVATTYGPIVARLHASGERAQLQRTATYSARIVLVVAALGALALAVFPKTFLGLFGSDFDRAAGALRVLALGYVADALAGQNAILLIMTGNERQAASGLAVGLALNVVLNAALIPPLGITGAAAAAVASLIAWNVLLVRRVWRRLRIDSTALGIAAGRARA